MRSNERQTGKLSERSIKPFYSQYNPQTLQNNISDLSIIVSSLIKDNVINTVFDGVIKDITASNPEC